MLTSPFDTGSVSRFDSNKFNQAQVIFVADMFIDEYVGGAELTTQALIDSATTPTYWVKANHVTPELIQAGVGKHWVFCNYTSMQQQLIPVVIANLSYSIIEYDYKFCKYRSIEKHEVAEGKPCDCHDEMQGKLTSAFFHGADNVFWMSQKQSDLYVERFPFLSGGNNHILSSVFSINTLDRLKELRSKYRGKKNDKWLIIGSTSWIKGASESEETCKINNLEYETVWGLPYEEMLEKLAQSKGHVYSPPGGDTCPRVVIEAKLLGCDLLINDNVQHKYEDWFNARVKAIDEHLRESPSRFWKVIENQINHVPTISGYTTTRNCISQKYPFKQCIESLLGFCDQVVVVDGGSTDGTWEALEELSVADDRIIIAQNRRDWDHPRFAVFDGLQKAYARSLCTGEWCWQMDSDEVVHENDYGKVKEVIKRLPKATDLIALPVIEYWGGPEKVRIDVNPWKWRLSRNRKYITHGIPKQLRVIDEEDQLYARPGTDGCDYIDTETHEIIPCTTFYTKEVHQLRENAFKNGNQGVNGYENWYNQIVNVLPSVYHYSWFDIERKIKTYRGYWTKHWQSLYNIKQEDTPENNMFFKKKWSDVTDEEIEQLSKELGEKMGGWIFHEPINFNKPTPWVKINRGQPELMKSWNDKK